jgi:HlyD family secretion protein
MEGTDMNTMARPGRTRWIVISAVALVALAGGVYAIRGGGDGANVTQVRGPDMGHARKTAFEISTTAVGELEAKKNVELRNPLEDTATIVTIVDEGSAVRAGDVLIQLNSDPIKTRVDEETLRVESGRAELVAAQNEYDIQVNENASRLRDAHLKVELAEIALRQWEEGDLKKKLQSLDLEINRATLELDRLAEKLLNSEEVYAARYMSKDERDRDEVAYIQAIAAYKDAILALDVYDQYEVVAERKQKESDVQSARDELERIQLDNAIELASKQANLNNKRTSLSILEAKLEKLKAQYAAATIRAPQDGLVVYATSLERGGWGGRGEGPLQIGQQVYPNQLMMILPDTSSMVAAVRVQESLAGRVRPGQPATVKIDAAGGRMFRGSVESIGVMAETGGWRDPNLREYTVRIAVDPDGADLKPAMRAEASNHAGQRRSSRRRAGAGGVQRGLGALCVHAAERAICPRAGEARAAQRHAGGDSRWVWTTAWRCCCGSPRPPRSCASHGTRRSSRSLGTRRTKRGRLSPREARAAVRACPAPEVRGRMVGRAAGSGGGGAPGAQRGGRPGGRPEGTPTTPANGQAKAEPKGEANERFAGKGRDGRRRNRRPRLGEGGSAAGSSGGSSAEAPAK